MADMIANNPGLRIQLGRAEDRKCEFEVAGCGQ